MKGKLAMHRSPRCIATSKRTRLAVPGAGSHRLDGLPVPRRAWWRAEGRAQWGLQAWATHGRGGGGAAGSVGVAAAGTCGACRFSWGVRTSFRWSDAHAAAG